MRARCRFTADFKAKVALDALRGDKSIQEISTRHKVHPNQVSTWRRQTMDGLGAVFSSGGVHRVGGGAHLLFGVIHRVRCTVLLVEGVRQGKRGAGHLRGRASVLAESLVKRVDDRLAGTPAKTLASIMARMPGIDPVVCAIVAVADALYGHSHIRVPFSLFCALSAIRFVRFGPSVALIPSLRYLLQYAKEMTTSVGRFNSSNYNQGHFADVD